MNIPIELIRDTVARHFHSEVAAIELAVEGISGALVALVRTANDNRLVVKAGPGVGAAEQRGRDQLAPYLSTPRIHQASSDVVVMEQVPGPSLHQHCLSHQCSDFGVVAQVAMAHKKMWLATAAESTTALNGYPGKATEIADDIRQFRMNTSGGDSIQLAEVAEYRFAVNSRPVATLTDLITATTRVVRQERLCALTHGDENWQNTIVDSRRKRQPAPVTIDLARAGHGRAVLESVVKLLLWPTLMTAADSPSALEVNHRERLVNLKASLAPDKVAAQLVHTAREHLGAFLASADSQQHASAFAVMYWLRHLPLLSHYQRESAAVPLLSTAFSYYPAIVGDTPAPFPISPRRTDI